MTELSLADATTEVRRGAEAVSGAVGQAGLLFSPVWRRNEHGNHPVGGAGGRLPALRGV